jgi:hypothetical protein
MVDLRRYVWLLLPLVAMLAACATKQRVSLDVVPAEVTIYLDGKPLAGVPTEVELRADQGHVLFFRAEGYRPERVMFFSRQRDGKPYLEPAEVRLQLVPRIASTRNFEIRKEEP